MSKQTINIGVRPNDGKGDTIRTAFTKTNNNFTEVFNTAQAAFNAANTYNSIDINFTQAAFDKANVASIPSSLANGEFRLTLNDDGSLTAPGVITGSETASTWTANITAIDLGTATIITFDSNQFSGPVIGQVVIEGVGGTTQANGTWYYQAWDSNQLKLFTDSAAQTAVDSTEWSTYTSGGTVTNLNGGGLSIEANLNRWHFSADGNLYVPGNVIVGGNNDSNGNEQHFIIDSTQYWTSIQWKNFDSPQDPNNTPFECQAQLLRVFANENTVTAWCNVTNPREELVAQTAIRPNGTNFNGMMFSTSETKIPDYPYNDGTGSRYDWILHGDGTTQFPNMPSNARTGNGDALIFTKMNGRTGQKIIGTQGGTAAHPTVERLVIAGGDGYGTGEGGDIYLWAGRSSPDADGSSAGGGDIKVDAGDAYDSTGGTVKIRGGNVYAGNNNVPMPAGWIEIDAGSTWNGGNGADITLNAGNAYGGGDDGKVRVSTGKGTHNFDFTADGKLTLPGGVINSTASITGSGDPVYPTALDLTKTINKLSNNSGSNYTLADGVEGQIMHILPQNGATIGAVYIIIANARLLNVERTTTASVITNAAYYPFQGASTGWQNNIATLIFTDGAWNVSTGSFDY